MRIDISKTLTNMELNFSKLFSSTKMVEGTNQVYFTMTGYKSKMLSNLTLDIIVEKSDIKLNKIVWRYITNPINKMVCEKVSNPNKMIGDIIKVMDFLEFDTRYLESVQLIKDTNTDNQLSSSQVDHIEWLKEQFQVRVGSSISLGSSAGSKKGPLGIDYDTINVNLIVY